MPSPLLHVLVADWPVWCFITSYQIIIKS